MEYLILSDSHRAADKIREVLARQVSRPNGVFFLGDGVSDAKEAVGSLPLYTVRGNCDGFLSPDDQSPAERTVTVGNLRILLMHGHLFSVKAGPGAAIAYAARSGADILLFGHTHEAYTETIDAGESVGGAVLSRPLLVCNPGSIGYDGSFAVLTVKDGIPHISFGTL
mgnify:CR=1 FL=1